MCVCYSLRVLVRERERKVANLGIQRPLRNNKGVVFGWGQDSLRRILKKKKAKEMV